MGKRKKKKNILSPWFLHGGSETDLLSLTLKIEWDFEEIITVYSENHTK
jgi:hypothetical protein